MRSTLTRLVLALLLAGGVVACSDHSTERGLAPPDEEAAPTSSMEMQESNQERQGQVEQDIEKKTDQEFDQDATKPEGPEQAP